MQEKSAGLARIRSIQIIRAIAALAVTLMHAMILWGDKVGAAHAFSWTNGAAGVDLFFVVSGFIMIVSGSKLAKSEEPRPARRFMAARLIRLVPLYWIATTLKLAMLMAAPAQALVNARPPLINVICSYLFIPSLNAKGEVYPIVVVGWTLSFELLFYLLFAAALAVRAKPLGLLLPVLATLSLVSLLRTPDWPPLSTLASPLLLEFLMGMIVGEAFLEGRLAGVSTIVGMLLLGAGLTWLAVGPYDDLWVRAIGFGLAAMAALAGGLCLERFCQAKWTNPAVLLGEASYSLYLVHGFVLPIVGYIVTKLHLPAPVVGLAIVLGGSSAAVVAALLSYKFVEQPIISQLNKRFRTRGPERELAISPAPL